ncbi:MAG TPA: hypothetical protein DIT40_02760 [Alphaproteobacteria bacterium]|jgi:multicomponent Na+:H+ antiporter subunit E|nr:hypothetical protein [Alphaproteobacteria bacterium]HBA42330.1 hypothetical protein [Alphaproteobacteria bacterium]HBC53906.1 hypothetical protein [Alphaproteobacteria bacterium]HCO89872.1 hypothetical protein [Alphaproteobacteria bacterium]
MVGKLISVVRAFALAIVLFLLWLGLSGIYTPLLLALGAFSSIFVALLCLRLGVIDEEGAPFGLFFGGVIGYWVWLFKEIVVANLNVARLILRPRMPLSPNFFNAPASQKSDLGKVVFANSITLTPGTVAIEVQGDSILVHTLSADFAWGAESCDMDRRVAALEKG